MTKLKLLDLFSGIGGFSLGLERTGGFETVAFCEIEVFCQKVLKKHWPDVPIYEDVRTIDYDETIDVICGGFPCQDISIAGKGAGIKGEKSGLWKEFKRNISKYQPKYAIIENVSALCGRGLEVVLQDIAEIGYDATWTMLDTKYSGKPQRRRRVYILAVRDGVPINADIFRFAERSTNKHKQEMATIEKSFAWDFTQGAGKRKPFAFFTRQRSDQFACTGLSSTLAKRDYKSYTDLVVEGGYIRRVTPQERMSLQGFPSDWMEDLGLTNQQQFTCNGMSTTVVENVGEMITEFDRTCNA
jgi:DNA (cytosine-5)-methyltransferase 1